MFMSLFGVHANIFFIIHGVHTNQASLVQCPRVTGSLHQMAVCLTVQKKDEDAGQDEEVLWDRKMAPAALQCGRGPGSGV